jgi:hypothetical protein
MQLLGPKGNVYSILLLASALITRGLSAAPADALPHFDKRAPQTFNRKTAAEATESLRTRVPKLTLDWEPITHAPKWIANRDGFLTEPRGANLVPAPALAKHGNHPHRLTKAFVDEHQAIFGHNSTSFEQAKVAKDYTDEQSGLRTTVWQQQFDGVEVFEAVFLSHVTRREELVNVASQFVPKLDEAGRKAGGAARPQLSAAQALVVAAHDLGQELKEADLRASGSAVGNERKQRFTAPAIRREAHTRLVWLPTSDSTMTLCWEVALCVRARAEVYRILIDARSGEVLVRRCQTTDISNASYRVFTGDSPTPMSPGYASPGNTNQPATVSRSLVTLQAINTTASPNGWINDGVNETRGNNVDASTDTDADNVLDLPRPQGSPNRVFDFSMNLGSAPSTYKSAAVVNLFYWCNWTHDKLYELGFNEAAGNFQLSNFGKGGLGNDDIRAEAQDGGGTKNANFNWNNPADGNDVWIQMYLWPDATPDRDGDLDTQIVLHEYVHGLSTRLVGGGVGLSGGQPEGMGEGWSDFYALALLSKVGDALNGTYPLGAYALRDYKYPNSTPWNENYYYGIRRYPYATNLNINPLTFKDIDGGQFGPYPSVPISGRFPSWSVGEAHSVGEVWCMILWEVRTALIGKMGFTNGNQLMLKITTDGMKLSPPNPTFVQARDAIIQAELTLTGGTNKNELWIAFAKRGLGFDAVAPVAASTFGVLESYSVPDTLRITPLTDLKILGPYGGPITMAQQAYTLSNASGGSMNWSLVVESPLQASPPSGTLGANGKVTVNVTLNTAAANTLPVGSNQRFVRFSNHVSHAVSLRRFTFKISEPLQIIPWFYQENFEILRGPTTGPFTLLFDPMVLSNRSDIPMSWKAIAPPFFTATPSNGTLAAHAAVEVNVGADSAASFLPVGEYTNTLVLSNTTTTGTVSRQVKLQVRNDDYLTAGFFADDLFNLTGRQITFIPDGSSVFYAVCNEAAASFPVNPAGGTPMTQSAYSYPTDVEVLLSGGKTVQIYGYVTNKVRVNFNGSISFGEKDYYNSSSVVEHFDRLRISGMHSDFDTDVDSGADVSWKQLADRFVVTWQDVVETFSFVDNETNSFQVEMFFDGRLRVTILKATDPWCVTGVSRGTNTPPDFISTDFSAFGNCANVLPKLIVTGPPVVTEGMGTLVGAGTVKIPSPRPQSTVVSLSSSDTSEITVPSSVTIPIGATSAVFSVTVVNDALRDGTKTATITASNQFFQKGQFTVLVNDNESNVLSVLTFPSVTEGGIVATGMVMSKFPVDESVLVVLQTSRPDEINFGFFPFVSFSGGSTSAPFFFAAVDDRRIDGTQLSGIFATVSNWTSVTSIVQAFDNETTNLQIFSPLFLTEGLGYITNGGEVRISGTLTTNLEVTIVSDDFFSLFGFSPVTIPAGQTNAFFTLYDWDNNTIDSLKLITFTASAPGFSNGTWGTFLFDNDGPPEPINPYPPDLSINVPRTTDISWGPPDGDLILNGGFESLLQNWTREDSGGGGWVSASSTYDPIGPDVGLHAGTGTRFALSQQYGNGRHVLWQEVFIPNGVFPVKLSWSQRLRNHAPAWTTNQLFRVELRDTDNSVLKTLWTTPTNAPLLNDWTNIVVDMAAYRGMEVRIAFVEIDSLGALNVSLDDVSLIATPPAATTWLVYFGTDSVPDATEYLGSTTNNTWALGTLATNTIYYWQVASVRAGATNFGPVWRFTTVNSSNLPPIIGLGNPGNFNVMTYPTNIALNLRALSDPDGSVSKVEYWGDNKLIGQVTLTPWSLTWSNPAPGEHSIFTVAQDNGGLRSTSGPVYISIVPTNGAFTTLIPWGSTWKFLDTGVSLGASWRSTSYSDSSWSNGPAQLGYGEGDEATIVDYGPSYNTKYITTYFRKTFSPPSGVQSYWLRVIRDDGLAVFMNGNEILRDNLVSGSTPSTLALSDITGTAENTFIATNASPTNLVGRGAVIAAELHQSVANSVDLSFDMELSAFVNPFPVATLTAPLANTIFVTPTNIALAATASDPYGIVARVQFFANSNSVGIISNAPYSLTWSNVPPGNYSLFAVATDDDGATNKSLNVPVFVVGPNPLLVLSNTPSQVILRWPSASSGYRVESATNLTPPISWTPLSNTPAVINGALQVTVPTNGLEQQFFRLVAP